MQLNIPTHIVRIKESNINNCRTCLAGSRHNKMWCGANTLSLFNYSSYSIYNDEIIITTNSYFYLHLLYNYNNGEIISGFLLTNYYHVPNASHSHIHWWFHIYTVSPLYNGKEDTIFSHYYLSSLTFQYYYYLYLYLFKNKKPYTAVTQKPLVQIYLVSYHHSDFLWYLLGRNRDTLMSNPPESTTCFMLYLGKRYNM